MTRGKGGKSLHHTRAHLLHASFFATSGRKAGIPQPHSQWCTVSPRDFFLRMPCSRYRYGTVPEVARLGICQCVKYSLKTTSRCISYDYTFHHFDCCLVSGTGQGKIQLCNTLPVVAPLIDNDYGKVIIDHFLS